VKISITTNNVAILEDEKYATIEKDADKDKGIE